ncbi:MAG: calcium/sodium antiporter [Xanthomonadales bacterium]|nr:calcium/sodium antiporter [Xanthomonadales bacterium]
MTETLLYLLAGSLGLYLGGEWLVSGGSRLSLRFGVSPLIIGLTVVALGTSSPELAVSLRAALGGSSEIALGNVVGSNICNIALILGLAAVVRPITIQSRLIRHDVPIMLACCALIPILLVNGKVGRLDGVVLALSLIGYIGFNLWDARMESREVQDEYRDALSRRPPKLVLSIVLIVAGLFALTYGARYFVDGAVSLGKALGFSESFIALTVVALGTSLPELAASVIASARGQGDIAVGNVVGSNIFNVLAVLGLTAIVTPIGIGGITRPDLGFMVLLSVALLGLVITGRRLSRLEGWLLLGVYFGYMIWRGINL